MNIITEGNVTTIQPVQDDNASEQAKNNCIKIARFNALNKQLYNNCCNANCSICNNSISKSISNGSYDASIMLVDAFPSEYESFTGCFTDQKGYLLNDAICGMKRSSIYCTTLIKCHNIKDTNPDIINNCLNNYFKKELELIEPEKLILTFSAFQACLKYQIIPYIGSINYFTKTNITINDINTNLYVVYDFNNLTPQTTQAMKQGLKMILQ